MRDREHDEVSDLEMRLAKRIALDVGIHDSPIVVEAVRRHHGGIYSRSGDLSADEYSALRDVIEAELLESQPDLFE